MKPILTYQGIDYFREEVNEDEIRLVSDHDTELVIPAGDLYRKAEDEVAWYEKDEDGWFSKYSSKWDVKMYVEDNLINYIYQQVGWGNFQLLKYDHNTDTYERIC